jgi:hypothetical protein
MLLRKLGVRISNSRGKRHNASLTFAICILQLTFVTASYAQEAKDLSPHDKTRLNHLKDGKETLTADDKPLLEQEARFHLHRLTQDKYWRKQPPGNLGLDDFVEDTCKLIPMPTEKKPLSDGQQQYLEAFASAYLGPIDEALRHREPIVKVNAARILARIAEAIGGSYSTSPSATGQAKVAEELLKIIKDKDQIDAVKFWALHGLEGLFNGSYNLSATPVDQRPNRRALAKDDLENQIIVALVDFVLRKPNLRPNPTPEEVEGFRYVRRQAIRALAQTRFPAVMNKKEFVGTPTALALSRVLVDDGISPTANLSEKLEAAIGICQLQTNLTNPPVDYYPDYAAHAVGLFIVELGKAFNGRPQIAQGQTPDYPWKLFAGRLLAALQSWKEANPTNTPSGKYIASLFEKFDTMIRTVQRKQGNVDVNSLQTWLQNPPPNNSLFKGHPETVVKPAEASSDQ